MAKRHLRQTATYWPILGSDGFGGHNFDTPVLLNVRWDERKELFTDDDGDQQVSSAIVYTEIDTPIGGFLAQEDQTAFANPQDAGNPAFRVRQFMKTTDLRNVQIERKAIL